MSLISKVKLSIINWASGNSINYRLEEEVYKEIIELLENLEQNLDKVISIGTLADKWAVIRFQNNIYTLPLLKMLIKDTFKKSQNYTMEEMDSLLNYVVELQKMYDKYEQNVKKRIIKLAPQSSEFQEIYYILIEFRKILASHLNLEAIKNCNYNDLTKFPSYISITQLKLEITKRRMIILPYLSEIDYNYDKER